MISPQENDSGTLILHNNYSSLVSENVNFISLKKSVENCRNRYRKRKFYRKLIESSTLCTEGDERPYANVKIFDDNLYVFGKDSMEFIKRHSVILKPFHSFISTANGSR